VETHGAPVEKLPSAPETTETGCGKMAAMETRRSKLDLTRNRKEGGKSPGWCAISLSLTGISPD